MSTFTEAAIQLNMIQISSGGGEGLQVTVSGNTLGEHGEVLRPFNLNVTEALAGELPPQKLKAIVVAVRKIVHERFSIPGSE